ncbi:MAG: hypothetical protein KAU31_06585 [Spirochaetaceae bacterium]|nr:hypothetical protein [Spirochaetaceae bacterium]
MADSKLQDASFPPSTPLITWDQVHWRTNQLLDVPPVLLVTECDPFEFRKAMARFIDGRHVNDALYRGVLAIRRESDLEPHPYVVAVPEHAAEIPVDLRAISEEEPQLDADLADHVHTCRREQAIQLLREMSRDGSEISISDIGDHDDRFFHSFVDGVYRHRYRYVATHVPEVGGS